jgi:hypothetical protein
MLVLPLLRIPSARCTQHQSAWPVGVLRIREFAGQIDPVRYLLTGGLFCER